jgi:hypothetical protein
MNRIRKHGNLYIVASPRSEIARSVVEEKAMPHISSTKTTDPVIVFMRESELQKKGAFTEFAKRYNPQCVLDMRTAPRLDLFAGSRLLAFKLFKEMHMEYFDFFGRVGIYSKENIVNLNAHLTEALIAFHPKVKYSNRPLVLFFDNDELLKNCKNEIPNIFLKHFDSSTINIAEYKSGFLAFHPTVALMQG